MLFGTLSHVDYSVATTIRHVYDPAALNENPGVDMLHSHNCGKHTLLYSSK